MVNSKISILLRAVLALAWLAAPAFADDAKKPTRVPLPKVSITKEGEKCVEPTDVMRRQHMQFIEHQRDETMHRGIRTSRHSLKNCVNCHADVKTGSVLGKDGFCQSCHHYAAVTIDCFSCHTDKAEKQPGATALPGKNGGLAGLVQATLPGNSAANRGTTP